MATKEETELFKNKYRVPSARLPGYDYANTGLYFVTICVKGRECVFGRVRQGIMELTGIGEIVKEELLKTNVIRPNVQIDEWIIMPNHVHVIVSLDNQSVVETHCNASLRDGMNYKNNFGPQKNNLSSIIRGFKSSTTARINTKYGKDYFAWQPRFHDHIIRNDKSLEEIRQYILKNPEKWLEDELYDGGLPKIQK